MSSRIAAPSSPRHHHRRAGAVDPPGSSDTLFDRTIELLLIGLALFAPAAFGAVEPWSEQIVIAVVALTTICFCLKLLLYPQTPFIWSWTYVPIALFLLLVCFQLLPLPLGVIRFLSPGTVALKTHLLSDISASPPRTMPISFYSWATLHDLRLLLAIVAIYIVCLNVFSTSRRVKRLLAGLCVVGGLVSLLALAQDVSGTDKVYWILEDAYIRKATAGPFIHYNTYCQFMNVMVGCGIALLLVLLEERRWAQAADCAQRRHAPTRNDRLDLPRSFCRHRHCERLFVEEPRRSFSADGCAVRGVDPRRATLGPDQGRLDSAVAGGGCFHAHSDGGI